MLSEPTSAQHKGDEELTDSHVAVARGAATRAASNVRDSAAGSMYTVDEDALTSVEQQSNAVAASRTSVGKRWWILAAVSALVLTLLTAAGIYLLTKKPSTVDQLVILTVPSGADIKLDSKDYGHSPVKLERLTVGTYTLTISKDGYEPIEEPLTVLESGPPIEYKLKPVPPSEAVGLPPEEQIRTYQQHAEEAFARGNFGIVYEGSALYYADNIRNLDTNNAFALEMRDRIRNAAHQQAQAAIPRGDLAQAQEIYNFLIDQYPGDEEVRAAAAKLESQLAARRGEVRDLLRKADEALQAGRLDEPLRTSAYFYSKQALAIDRQNDKARQIRNQVRETLASAGEQAVARGDIEAAIKQFEHVSQLFPEDKQSRSRARDIQTAHTVEVAKQVDPGTHRVRGLDLYISENYNAAIPELEAAVVNGRGGTEVLFALARSYMKTGRLDQAESYFAKIKPSGEDVYRSTIASLGDISKARGDTSTAVEKWKEARQLGGSTLYSVAALEDKIEAIEKKQREKAAEPTPISIQVKHLHGGLLGGSCSGTLTINATGVRYDGVHVFASNLVGAGVSFTKDEMFIKFQGNQQKFRVARGDAERVRETLARYQQTYSPSNK
jgi:PEGA domain-containing protein/tetratricopeptide repeat protein